MYILTLINKIVYLIRRFILQIGFLNRIYNQQNKPA